MNEGTDLHWRDIDFKNKRMRVYHNLFIKIRNDWKRNNYTKVDGRRVISLDDDTVKILKDWKKRQAKVGKIDFVLSYDGSPMRKSTIARIINRYAKLAGVHPIPAKGLRHSHASYLINEFNVSVLILSKRMGHSSPEITLKHYSHMWSGLDETIADEMTGNIKIQTAKEKKYAFNGNQAIKYNVPKDE